MTLAFDHDTLAQRIRFGRGGCAIDPTAMNQRMAAAEMVVLCSRKSVTKVPYSGTQIATVFWLSINSTERTISQANPLGQLRVLHV